MGKILIAFYSRKGQNYVSGSIRDLKVGNTEAAAGLIRGITGGDLFKIDTVKEYPADYTETTDVAKDELRKNARPELAESAGNLEEYDKIILGYPNWWGTMPMAVFTFLESYDFSGKTIAPFCTHEGSGLGHSVRDIAKLCPKAAVTKGLAIHGTGVSGSGKDIKKWLDEVL
ncbi:flavodoxin [Youngiibacter fragilis]|jgi:flavodoxin|uniref:Flavodoxin n=1 Tax=Youngiibacter fragilis 232.1 TaxID=994573 RepID=V7I0W1_9CLOT|nr:flavodoxin [Youngiibacter fragilis]ETA79508.1 flavodoxin [Youngiibacter fragilis 232.1]